MRNPKFGNRFKFVPNTRVHRNLNGELRTYQGTIPTWEGFSVQYEALSQADCDTLENFLITSVGELITLTDFESRLWTGVITSHEIEIVENRDLCSWSTGFEFEGHVTGTLAAPIPNSPLSAGFGISIAIPSYGNFPNSPFFATLPSADSLDATQKTVLDGGNVTILADEGSSVNLTLSGTGTSIYRAAKFNGAGAIELNGKFMSNSLAYPSSYTAFIVAERIGTTGNVFQDTTGLWNLGWEGAYENQAKAGATILNLSTAPDANPHLYVMSNTGTHAEVWRDSVQKADVLGSFGFPNGLRLGYGYIGAVAVYAGILSQNDRDEISYYLMGQFGIPLPW